MGLLSIVTVLTNSSDNDGLVGSSLYNRPLMLPFVTPYGVQLRPGASYKFKGHLESTLSRQDYFSQIRTMLGKGVLQLEHFVELPDGHLICIDNLEAAPQQEPEKQPEQPKEVPVLQVAAHTEAAEFPVIIPEVVDEQNTAPLAKVAAEDIIEVEAEGDACSRENSHNIKEPCQSPSPQPLLVYKAPAGPVISFNSTFKVR